MSEPVIKATGARWCPKCRHASHGNPYGAPWMHCSFDDVDTVPLYTRDDLVSAVLAGIALVNGGDVEDQRRHIPTAAQAARVVDRLTKGET